MAQPILPLLKLLTNLVPHILSLANVTWVRQDKLLFGCLVGILSPFLGPLISRAHTSKEACDILANTYAKPSRGHIKQLRA